MEEIFLDIDAPGFKEQDSKIKAEGYVERKYTSSAAKDIEAAFKRHLLKQLISARGLSTPAQINALKPELNEAIKTTLYKVGADGAKIFKFQMYIPSEKLRREREKALMNEEYNVNEDFAPNNYSNITKKADKVNQEILKAYANIKNISVNSKPNTIEKALEKSKKVYNLASELKAKANVSGNITLRRRAYDALSKATQIRMHSEAIHKQASQPIDELSNMLSRFSISNMQSKPRALSKSGYAVINNDFIENILTINNNNNNNNNINKSRMPIKALASGRSSGELKFIKEIVELFMKKGMDKKMAIKLGVVLANLETKEFDNIEKTVKKSLSEGLPTDTIAQQLYQYISSKQSGGKRRTHKKRYSRRK
jgi:hypothetical protein